MKNSEFYLHTTVQINARKIMSDKKKSEYILYDSIIIKVQNPKLNYMLFRVANVVKLKKSKEMIDLDSLKMLLQLNYKFRFSY